MPNKSPKSTIIDIRGIEKAALLAALYNGLNPGGASEDFNVRTAPMTKGEAQDIINRIRGPLSFTHVKGRALMVDITGDSLDPQKYDQNLGQKAAEKIIVAMRPQSSQPQPVAKNAPPTTAALRV